MIFIEYRGHRGAVVYRIIRLAYGSDLHGTAGLFRRELQKRQAHTHLPCGPRGIERIRHAS